jgi:DNA-binding CsgD family transcriptional regulator
MTAMLLDHRRLYADNSHGSAPRQAGDWSASESQSERGVTVERRHAGDEPETDRAGAGAGREAIYEREAELAELSAALTAARAGAGRLVVIEGPAGIGKSRLLAEAHAMAETQGMAVLAARGIELERDASFGVAAGLFAAMLTAAPDRERARLLSGQASLAATLFDPAAPETDDSSALVRGLYWLTVNVAASSPGDPSSALLIEVDDIQWADRPSLSFLAYLAARIDELPAVLVVTMRSGERAEDQQTLQWLRERPAHGVLTPRTLTAPTITQLVRAELPASEPGFIQACAEASGGNPFLARELLWALRTEEIAPTDGSAALVRSLVPDAVLRSVLVRLNRRGDAARQLAQAVAVLGDQVPLRHARLLARLDAEAAEAAADALADVGILAVGEPLRFTHPLIGSSVYTDIPAFARARAHRRARDVLTADGAPLDAVAAHALLTFPDGDQRTVTVLRQAAAQALHRGDPGAGARLLARALAEPPAQAARGHVLLELAHAELEQGQMSARARIDEALPMFATPEDQVPALAALARLHFNRGAHEAAASVMEEALELLKPEDAALPPLLVSYLTASTFRAELAPLAAKRLQPLIEAARDGRPPDDPGLLAHLVLRLAFADEAAAPIRVLAARATAADPLVEPAGMGILAGLIVQALCCVDELDDAEHICAAAIAAARRRGSLLSFTTASYHRAIGRYHRGELSSALADLDQALLASREGWTAGDPWVSSLRAHIHVERGDLAAAREALRLTAGAPPGSMDLPIARFAHAVLALADGRPELALADAETAGQLLSTGFGIDHPGFVPWRHPAALAAHALGDHSHARRLAREQLDRARSSGTARALGLALRTQAAISEGEHRIAALAEAAEVLARSPSALQRAHALVELGAARRRAGQQSAAAQSLREGLQLADRMGATALLGAARHELRALGLRPRRSAVSGLGSLTPTEHRVAELAASGLTNRQLAEALFVTVKTVETHLAHIYQKLGTRSRAELTRLIGESSPGYEPGSQ